MAQQWREMAAQIEQLEADRKAVATIVVGGERGALKPVAAPPAIADGAWRR